MTTNRQLAESIVKQLVNCDDPEWFIRQTEQLIAAHVQEQLTTTQTALRMAVEALEDLLNHGASVANPTTGEQEQYQSNPQIAEDAIAAARAALKE